MPGSSPRPGKGGDDWFLRAAQEAAASRQAKFVAARAADRERLRRARAKDEAEREAAELRRMSSGGAREAARRFGIDPVVPNPAIEVRTIYRPPTTQEAYDAILLHVENAPDPFLAAGEWITKMTQGLSEIAREHMGED